VDGVVEECRRNGLPLAEITGGEPLLQPGFPELARALRDRTSATVLVETNGTRDISAVPDGVVCIMDVKTPGSGENAKMDLANLDRLRPYDEVKFVLTDRADYEWARQFTLDRNLAARCRAVLFSPVWNLPAPPGSAGGQAGRLAPSDLARWILEDRLPVRLQPQLHRILGLR
jgi:7-carboxy-7-deazaguanine synthase